MNGIHALDRGFDDEKFSNYFCDNELDFVIRIKTTRDVVLAKSGIKEILNLGYKKGINGYYKKISEFRQLIMLKFALMT